MDKNDLDNNKGVSELLPKPVGRSEWEYIAAKNYCVDKTLMIRDMIDTDMGVGLFTRPRRFGKTTNLQMIKCFFEKRKEGEPSARPLFERRAIGRLPNADKYMALQGAYPVIYLTFKDHKALTWESAQFKLRYDIGEEFARHKDAAQSLAEPKDVTLFAKIRNQGCDIDELAMGLGLLAKALHLHYKEKVYILIDEYDSPVTTASTNGYYEQMVTFMRMFLSGAMKDNNDVEKGIMTGVLRVAKEGMLSGLNNLKVFTVFDEAFSEYFGFTPEEVEEMARYYGREDKMDEVRSWYDGYVFGGREMYNPWSVLYYFDAKCKPDVYWLDTSSNDIIAEMVDTLPFDMVEVLEGLLRGGEPPVVQMTKELGPYQYIRNSPETLYALLVSAGYLKPVGGIVAGNCAVMIPNREVEHVFESDILSKFRRDSGQSRSLRAVEVAFFRRDPAAFREHVERFLLESASYFDASAEGFYHGLLLGMLSFMRNVYVITSNRESGYGRFDIMLKPRPESRQFPAVVIEVKATKDEADDLDALAAEARRQIDEKNYAASLEAEGVTDILKFGYAFCNKRSAIAK